MNVTLLPATEHSTIQAFIASSEGYSRMGDLNLHDGTQKRFAIVLKKHGQIVGGAVASINFDWVYVGTLWVDDSLRGQGVGKKLMRAVESHSHQQGLHGVYLYTIDFQAPEFYRKIGYRVMGTLPNRPQGHTATYYSKTDLATDAADDEFEIENPVLDSTSTILGTGLDHDAKAVAPIVFQERFFIVYDDEGIHQGGLLGHKFWGWLEVKLCYATSTEGLVQLLDRVESFCDGNQLGLLLPTYADDLNQLLLGRRYLQWSKLQNRPTGTTCTFWIRHPSDK